MIEEREQETASAELVALLRDLARNQAQITDTRWWADHTLTRHALDHPC